MSKLHFYKKDDKVADGDGTISKTNEFEAKISWGEVKKGHNYNIHQGQRSIEGSYNCMAGAKKNGTAKFLKEADK